MSLSLQVLYTGAGISASAVGQAARSGSATVGFKANPAAARPTLTHFALAFLARQGLVQGWVQQNHDGLPQKAGCPQHVINEIHGSWFDPGNPVVKYSGSLHERAYPWMRQEAETADLVLVLGTSLGGLNADQVLGYTVSGALLLWKMAKPECTFYSLTEPFGRPPGETMCRLIALTPNVAGRLNPRDLLARGIWRLQPRPARLPAALPCASTAVPMHEHPCQRHVWDRHFCRPECTVTGPIVCGKTGKRGPGHAAETWFPPSHGCCALGCQPF